MNAQLDSVQRQNRILLVANDSLGRNLTEKINENTLLTSTNNTLSQKVTVASLLLPQNIDLSGIRTKSNGKQKDTEKAKKADQLKLCFEVPENHVADPGMKTLFIRIINPQGVPLAIQDRGSGVFTTVESGQESQYTTVANVDYKQQRDNVCVNWSQGTPFESGKYVAEIYQDGYLVGKKEYELR